MAVQEARLARVQTPQPTVAASAMPAAVQPASQPTEPTHTGHPIDAWPPFYPFGPPTTSNVANAFTTGSNPTSGSDPTAASDPTSPVASPLPANVSQTLGVIYAAYQADPSGFPADIPTTNDANRVQIQGTSVGISVRDNNPADFSTLVAALQSDGMQITDSSAQDGVVDGFLPVAQLPAVASLPNAPALVPQFQPNLN